jgi:4-methylaminobutanoate oxidase (formaldehyde-forming)
MSIPNHANVVIVGGGVAGCSIAYHLTKIGITDVVLLERKQLTSGTTWHAAGLVGQLRATRNLTELAKYTADLYRSLEAETGQATGFKQNGSISVAKTPARLEELYRGASMGKTFGLEIDLLSTAEIRERWPLLEVGDLVGGIFIRKDGQTNPIDTTQAFARGARMRGARIFENTKVERIRVEKGRAVGVETEAGYISADTVVLCAGMWSHALGRAAGVSVPLHAAEHFYIVTEPIKDVPPNLPVLRVYDECAYYKEDAGKLLVGCFEPVAKPWGMNGIPESFCFDSLPEDADHFEPILAAAVRRVPAYSSSSTGPRASRRMIATTSARHRRFAICSLPQASTRWALPRAAAQARSSRSGSRIVDRRWTWPTSTSVVRCLSSPTVAICTIARSRHWACSTRCIGRTTSTRRRAVHGVRHCTIG